ncbi:MAG: hypothetical protein WC812_03960 [Candidatus Pacearchaeota archaeon]|jgi:hypothetical protein
MFYHVWVSVFLIVFGALVLSRQISFPIEKRSTSRLFWGFAYFGIGISLLTTIVLLKYIKDIPWF